MLLRMVLNSFEILLPGDPKAVMAIRAMKAAIRVLSDQCQSGSRPSVHTTLATSP
jgi:hypothetical protein